MIDYDFIRWIIKLVIVYNYNFTFVTILYYISNNNIEPMNYQKNSIL